MYSDFVEEKLGSSALGICAGFGVLLPDQNEWLGHTATSLANHAFFVCPQSYKIYNNKYNLKSVIC